MRTKGRKDPRPPKIGGMQPQQPQNQRRSQSQPELNISTVNYSTSNLSEMRQKGINDPRHPEVGGIQLQQPQDQSRSHSQPELNPSTVNSTSNILGSSDTTKKTRGPTRGIKLFKKFKGDPLPIEENEFQQPIGDNAQDLSTYFGLCARNCHRLPLTYSSWKHMPKERKEAEWNEAKTKFGMDHNFEDYFKKKLGRHWKDWKHDLKENFYKKYNTYAERLVHRDPRVDPNQWKILIEFLESAEGKKRSTIGTANRAKQRMSHTAGTRAFALVREAKKKQRVDGTAPTRAELFIDTHTRKKDGQPVDEESANIILKLKEIQSQAPENSQGIQQGASYHGISQDDAIAQVMGPDKNGCVRLLGFGPSPSKLWGKSNINAQAMQMAEEVKRVAEENERRARKQLTFMKSKVESLTTILRLLAKKLGDGEIDAAIDQLNVQSLDSDETTAHDISESE